MENQSEIIMLVISGVTLVFIVTDKRKLEQTLTNLLDNAIKFTEAGKIEFGCKLKSKQLYFWVKDSGKGISKAKQKEIFERFRQENTNVLREAEGMGLGLSISKAFVEKLGGEIGVESKEGKGSDFGLRYLLNNQNKFNQPILVLPSVQSS